MEPTPFPIKVRPIWVSFRPYFSLNRVDMTVMVICQTV